MPAVVAALLGGLISITGSLVGRVLVALGISVVTYSGMDASLSWLRVQAVQALQGTGADVVGMLSVMRVGQCISIVTSAILARALITGINSDSVKRWVLK